MSKKVNHSVKNKKKKTFWQEWRVTIIAFFVIVLGILVALNAPEYIRSLKYLRISGNKIAGIRDNWIVSRMDKDHEYYLKIAEMGETEGFELKEVASGIVNKKEQILTYVPTDSTTPIQECTVVAGAGSYNELAEKTYDMSQMQADSTLYQGEIVQKELEGKNTAYYIVEYTYVSKNDDGSDGALKYNQYAFVYVESNVEDRCVLVSALNTGEDASVFADRDALISSMEPLVAAIAME